MAAKGSRKSSAPNGVCAYCGRPLQSSRAVSDLRKTRDHIIPRNRGGKETVPCCFLCNSLKGGMMPKEWTAFMKQWPEWWLKFRRSPGKNRSLRTKSNREYWEEFTSRERGAL